jgi:hypothetical protein
MEMIKFFWSHKPREKKLPREINKLKKSEWPLKSSESVKWENKWNKVLKISIFSLARYLLCLISFLFFGYTKNIIKNNNKKKKALWAGFLLVHLDFLRISFHRPDKMEKRRKIIFLLITFQAFIGEWWICCFKLHVVLFLVVACW